MENEAEMVTLCKGTEDEMVCIGYRRTRLKEVIFGILVVLSLGIVYLVTHWKPVWRVVLTCLPCRLSQANLVILKLSSGDMFIEEVIIVDLSDLSEDPFLEGMAEYTYIAHRRTNSTSDDRSTLTLKTKILLKYFDHKHIRFVWKEDSNGFVKLSGLDFGVKCQEICENFLGLSKQERINKLRVFGSNSILVEVKSYVRLFFEEVLNPFYVFQIFSVTLWFCDNYYIYASCIVLISTISLGVELYETRKQRETLRDMVASTETKINVCLPSGEVVEIESHDLVPGDVITIPANGFTMSCDAVLVAGNAIVDEGMLTGESVPVTKTPLSPTDSDETYSPEAHKRNTLFCGTRVIQTRYYGDAKVKAVVVRTGFSTAKGELVRSILYPKELMFEFYADAFKFIIFLAIIAASGMIYICVNLILQKFSAQVIIINMLDIVTVAVPPALPAAMTVGTIFAQSRLKKAGIFCISPQRINLGGKIQCFCFDKTGTLTEEGLDLWAVLPVKDGKFLPPVHEPCRLPPENHLVKGMATCHSLTVIEKELSGDPLDLKMFNSINWVLEEAGRETAKFDLLMPTVVKPIMHESYSIDVSNVAMVESPFEIGIVRQFTFSSGLQRMSVIVRKLGADHMDVYTKGAPEKIAALCNPETIPEDYQTTLHKYAAQGLRVIAVATKSLDHKISWHQIQRISRDAIECDLSFVGLLIMENKLKPETSPVIQQLMKANINIVMVTGDNILTAITVARHCGMIADGDRLVTVTAQPPEGDTPASIQWEEEGTEKNESGDLGAGDNDFGGVQSYQSSNVITDLCQRFRFAMSGRSFGIIHRYFPELVSKIVLNGVVFARMTPDQKSKLVEDLQSLGFYVGMCGDGANDCGALRTADVGISLSEAEASVASPFTSKTANISCVPTVIREGRAALTTSFAAFRFMALYSIIQFVTVIILVSDNSKLSDFMFLYADLMIITVLAVLMGRTAAYGHLVAKRPSSSLASADNIVGIMTHIMIIICFQLITFFYTRSQPWYEVPAHGGELDKKSMDTTSIFYVSSFQYLVLAFVLSKGPPYRKRIWTNAPFLIWLLLMVMLTLVLVIYPPQFLVDLFTLVLFPSPAFNLTLLGLSGINLFCVLMFEDFILHSHVFKSCARGAFCRKKKQKPYKELQNEADLDGNWPPVGEVTTAARDNDAIWHVGLDIS